MHCGPALTVRTALQELEKGLDSLEDTYRGDVAAASADACEAEAADDSEAAVPAGKKSWREALCKGGKKGRPPAKSARSSHGEALAGSWQALELLRFSLRHAWQRLESEPKLLTRSLHQRCLLFADVEVV